ncbi:STAS domain-containing protein [Caldichromatium japonicum]|uniref:STAS domain-containing protein n=1 Tax=Caldichromatium japonicum TaxID=2699430 RepID=A0A6G7VA80_9GAMM|nr:STAS domain-containing protein [Caldichromatium japonicum]QIK36973.1 STAS domain-containing protein [Caldichromatium japonicum]
MSAAETEASADDRLILAGELNIYNVAETYQRMQAYLERHPHCILDLSETTELDGAGLQLLLWLRDAVRTRGGSLRVVGVSPTVSELLELVQLSHCFGETGGGA